MAHVFISYSKQDRDYARRLADYIIGLDIDVWIDDRIDYGSHWWDEIDRAIADCHALIVIMTPESISSRWVRREVMLADERDKPIFPLLLQGENWSLLVDRQYVDVQNGELPPDEFFVRLAQHFPAQRTPGHNITPPEHAEPTFDIQQQMGDISGDEIDVIGQATTHIQRQTNINLSGINLTLVLAGIVTLLVVGGILLLRDQSPGGVVTVPTATQAVTPAVAVLPTEETTPAVTPSRTPDPDDPFEVTAEVQELLDAAALTRQANQTQTAVNAAGVDAPKTATPAADGLGFPLTKAISAYSNMQSAIESDDEVHALLSEAGEYTLFVPTNGSFGEPFEEQTGQSFADFSTDPAALSQLLKHHIVPRQLTPAELQAGITVETLAGTTLDIQIDDESQYLMIGDGAIVNANGDDAGLTAENGIAYEIWNVVLPPEVAAQTSPESE